jgi:hypothetical protein
MGYSSKGGKGGGYPADIMTLQHALLMSRSSRPCPRRDMRKRPVNQCLGIFSHFRHEIAYTLDLFGTWDIAIQGCII